MEKQLSSETVYKGRIISVKRDKVLCQNGRESTREVVEHNGACGVLPILPNGDFMLVKQFRYAFGKDVLEIPAGKLEKGENPLDCIKREMAEEIGKSSESIRTMGEFLPSVGCLTEVIHLFCAENLYDYKLPEDLDEDIKIVILSQDKARKMIKNNEIQDGKTLCAILKYWQGI